MGVGAAAGLRGLDHEVAVGRGSDPNREKPRRSELAIDDIEQIAFVADAAVGEKDDLP